MAGTDKQKDSGKVKDRRPTNNNEPTDFSEHVPEHKISNTFAPPDPLKPKGGNDGKPK
jgi:hypothetical protein